MTGNQPNQPATNQPTPRSSPPSMQHDTTSTASYPQTTQPPQNQPTKPETPANPTRAPASAPAQNSSPGSRSQSHDPSPCRRERRSRLSCLSGRDLIGWVLMRMDFWGRSRRLRMRIMGIDMGTRMMCGLRLLRRIELGFSQECFGGFGCPFRLFSFLIRGLPFRFV